MNFQRRSILLLLGLLCLFPCLAWGQEDSTASLDTGDTAWILTSTALVLFMTLPGLALFYAGLVHRRNVLSVLLHCFVLASMMSVIWLICGYSLSFSTLGMAEDKINVNSLIGGLDLIFLQGIGVDHLSRTIPTLLFFAFQMTFFVITPALIVGAFPERIRFSGMLWFMGIWGLLVYVPVCHMVWGGDGSLLGTHLGVVDHAGGIVVHITAGVAALAACIYIGPRIGYPERAMPPHNLPLTVIGTGMLWVGWFGFNAGSGLASNGNAAMSLIVTHISAATASLTWMFAEWMRHGKPSMLGFATGAIAGLAAITPASGIVGPFGALAIGFASGIICWYASTAIKSRFGYDDSLDVFGVHGVGGFVGTVLLAIFAHSFFGGLGGKEFSIGGQLGVQLLAAVAVGAYTLVVSLGILTVVDKFFGLRVSETEENMGLDVTSHGEAGYND